MQNNAVVKTEHVEDRLRRLDQLAADAVLGEMESHVIGLDDTEAAVRRRRWGQNEIASRHRRSILWQLGSRFASPLVLILLVIAAFSFVFGDRISATIVTLMAILSVVLAFVQEHKAERNAEALQEMVRVNAHVVRGGTVREVRLKEIVPGDVVELAAGDMVPADLKII
ncbi:MAG: cation-transporting P-type ATPase, partial [Patescibacteria group bacterium]